MQEADIKTIAFNNLYNTIKQNIPKGFEPAISYGMQAFVVPHSLYPKGYHCKPAEPLPFISVAAQKNFIAFYHMGMYAKPQLHQWFVEQYQALNMGKLDIGKSCVRFKKYNQIPFDLIAQLCQKMSVEEWITTYETMLKK